MDPRERAIILLLFFCIQRACHKLWEKGAEFFWAVQRQNECPNFFACPLGAQKRLIILRHKQMVPLLIKRDSSLKLKGCVIIMFQHISNIVHVSFINGWYFVVNIYFVLMLLPGFIHCHILHDFVYYVYYLKFWIKYRVNFLDNYMNYSGFLTRIFS